MLAVPLIDILGEIRGVEGIVDVVPLKCFRYIGTTACPYDLPGSNFRDVEY